MTMAIREIQSRYVGTLAGFVWSVINPLMMIFVFWFVFSVGFKIQPVGNAPFIVVFLCGLIPWTMFSETLMANTNAITGNVETAKSTFEILSKKGEKTKISSEIKATTIQVSVPASIPETPVKPKTKLNVLIAGIVGLIASIMVAFSQSF